jgi:hypothetical protein
MANFMPGEWDLQKAESERRRRFADQLLNTQQPQGGMVGNVYVPPSWTQQLATVLNKWQGGQMMRDADREERKVYEAQQQKYKTASERLADALRTKVTPAVDGNNTDDAAFMNAPGIYQPAKQPSVDEIIQAQLQYASDIGDPQAINQAATMVASNRVRQQERADDKEYREAVRKDEQTYRSKEADENRAFRAEQAALERQARVDSLKEQIAAREQAGMESANLRRELAQMQMQNQKEIARMGIEGRKELAAIVGAQKQQQNVPKLPTSALKLQQEELDAIGTASSVNADVRALRGQIETGKLNLGPMENVSSRAKNFVGMSDQNSRNFASFQATLEKIRNDSLRLNKGVQTEGDAVRAWNELVNNINDPKVVRQRLEEIERLNQRAADLRKMNVDNIRMNFGVDPLDMSGYQAPPAAVGQTAPPPGAVRRKK